MFFLHRSLPAQLKAVGQSSLVKYIVPKLLDVTMFVEPSIPTLYSVLFKPKERQGILEEPHFSEMVVPFILQMYQKPLKEVRLVLLDLIDCYISSIAMEDIYAAIMPQVSGFLLIAGKTGNLNLTLLYLLMIVEQGHRGVR